MTSDQKLDIVFKKLTSSKAFTKEGTQFFEEPFSSFQQVPLEYVYINSDYIPNQATKSDVSVNGILTVKYVDKELSKPFSTDGYTFSCLHNKLIPNSFGVGYGITLRTYDGVIIDQSEFPIIIDWESGKFTFTDDIPYETSVSEPPIVSYYSYVGATLGSVTSNALTGQRGPIGPKGPTGVADKTTMVYRGMTNFSNPGITYYENDVITYTTNGNTYICLYDTTNSPGVSPSYWENISPTGSISYLPANVYYVNNVESTPISTANFGSSYYFSKVQDAIDAVPDNTKVTIVVNQISNEDPLGSLSIVGKNVHIVFRKWANLFTTQPGIDDFLLYIKDSIVTIENAQIGGEQVYSYYQGKNEIIVESSTSDTLVEFVNCRINTKLISSKRCELYKSSITFNKCSVNSISTISNSETYFYSSKIFGSFTLDSVTDSIKTLDRILHIDNCEYISRMGEGRDGKIASDIVILASRDDLDSYSIKVNNSVLPAICVSLYPDTQIYSPDKFRIDANNSIIFAVRIDSESRDHGTIITAYGGGCLFFDGHIDIPFSTGYYTLQSPYDLQNGVFSNGGSFYVNESNTILQGIDTTYLAMASQRAFLSL